MVYLDYAATTPLLPEVIDAMHAAERRYFANASALHTPGHLAMNEIERVRALLAKIVGADPSEIIFTSGASESNNTVIRTFAGHQIETSPLEHHSILETAQKVTGDKLSKLYSYMLANNEIGEILNLPAIVEAARQIKLGETSANLDLSLFEPKSPWGKPLVTDRRGAYVHSDLTQVLGKIPVDVHALGLDYATFSAHKIGGPVGVGALYVKKGVPFTPLILGGNQEGKRRGGTYNTVGIIGFGVALEKLLGENSTKPRPTASSDTESAVPNATPATLAANPTSSWFRYDRDIRRLRDELARRILKEIPGSSLNTDLKNSLPNILNASFEAAEGESIQLYLDAEGIVVSTGSACAAGDTKPSHVLMAKTGDAEVAHSSIRFSFGLEGTMEDVEKVMAVLPGIIKRLQGMSTIKMKGKN